MARTLIFPREPHLKVVKAIKVYDAAMGFPPSYRDIMSITGINSTSLVGFYVSQLEEHGYLTRVPHITRSLVLTSKVSELIPNLAG